jgi:hypothetical protein
MAFYYQIRYLHLIIAIKFFICIITTKNVFYCVRVILFDFIPRLCTSKK